MKYRIEYTDQRGTWVYNFKLQAYQKAKARMPHTYTTSYDKALKIASSNLFNKCTVYAVTKR